ncbi:MAG TPA: DUF1549 and DUF1553 domain-containing protein [Tepidisphaeraceae bacterium]|jgi:hypothetical protein|nr:DUF1549 and DUF1553 domain-containing protein [Tepidisphaeraceae bacterium]
MRPLALLSLIIFLVAHATGRISSCAEAPATQPFWSLQPLGHPAPPAVKNGGWVRNPVDAFVLAKLEKAGLSPAPQAPRGKLIRRLYFDLLGLPPTPAQLATALNDSSADWYPHLVDQLLADPHYGERWARHWLDTARYADSDGYENDGDRPGAYFYRDFVIRAFNDDLPYNTFLQWNLAGDELAPANQDAHLATGFLAAAPWLETGTKLQSELDKNRYDELDDMLTATGQAMLGLTINCARCHDHKFDPIPTRDYYRMLATFASTKRENLPVMTDVERSDFRKRIEAFEKKLAEAKAAGNKKEVESLEKVRPKPIEALVITDQSPTPVASFLLRRGDPAHKVEQVTPGFLTCLTHGDVSQFAVAPPAGAKTTFQRAALAKWITDVDHGGGALAARVAVNRLWQHHFGEGIVRTPGDFGVQGDRPSHPELLDYLADQLIARGWSIKAIQRLILASNTYQMDTTFDAASAKVDPDNRLLWHRRPMRLEAEALRDAMLATAGTLNDKMYGPGVKPPVPAAGRDKDNLIPRAKQEGPEVWRRSIYIFTKRSLPIPLLEVFDAPTGNSPCTRRQATTVAPQALALLNDPFVRMQAEHFAKRIAKDAGDDPGKRITDAYLLALSRVPTASEMDRALKFLDRADREGAFVDLCQVLLGLNEFAYID